ncbi:synapsin-1 [Reticulomyxa filosa]|uniref:Synapsin-1 n=1 Tax=Reticulomyxa filosa TaxID=46433 RepID=X6MHX8_RETFI|nr:synapsin-1 [Reticulomyxa filosa]|eukprot:ETO12670.1 synapsin-1 [Reticulomyxa filosa]
MYIRMYTFLTQGNHNLRIQKIGKHYRVLKRVGEEKNDTENVVTQELELSARYKFWADVCAQCFGGLDIVNVDVLVNSEGKEYILKFDGVGAFGKPDEDNLVLKEFIIEKLNDHFLKQPVTSNNSGSLLLDETKI